jgi:hypothetical protein
MQNKIAIVIVSGSAGELDWNLEILELLLNEGFNLKIVILKRKTFKSIKQNKMINDFINQKNDKIEVIFRGGYFIEKIRQYIYLSYRILIKLKISKYPLMSNILNLFIKIFQRVFSNILPSNVLSDKSKKYLFLSEFPSLRKPWDVWMRKNFNESIFLYHPASQSIYANNLDQKFSRYQNIDFKKNHFLLLGHQLDYLSINDGRELASTDLEKVFLGHPNWSQKRIDKFLVNKKDSYLNSLTREKINILILSKTHSDYYSNLNYHVNLIETSVKSIQKIIPNSNVLIKKHPREVVVPWEKFVKKNSSIKIINYHVQQIAPKVDFVISIWNSASVDCYAMGVPVIEYYDTNKFPRGMIFEGDNYTSVYRKLGLVIPANNEKELQKAITDLVNTKYKLPSDKIHPFYKELENLSNTWEKKIRNILEAHDFITK